MKNLFLLLLMANLLNGSILAQVNIEWEKSLGGSDHDIPYAITEGHDGGPLIVGNSWSSDGDVDSNYGVGDFWLVKMDKNGKLLWQKNLGGQESEEAKSIQKTKDGGYIIAGLSASTDGDLKQNFGSYDYWIVKLDNKGNIKWQKTLGGRAPDHAQAIQQTKDDGYIVAGYTNSANGLISHNNGRTDYWIIKLDKKGEMEWEKSFGTPQIDKAVAIKQTAKGNYLVAGFTYSEEKKEDYFILKLDKKGKLIWKKTLGGSFQDQSYDLELTTDEGCIVVGSSKSTDGNVKSNKGNEDFWLTKLDQNGNLVWEQSYGGSGSDHAIAIKKNPNGGYIVVGSSMSRDQDIKSYKKNNVGSYWVISIDEQGELLWETSLGGSGFDQAKGLDFTKDGSFIVAGMSSSSDGNLSEKNKGGWDYWICQLKELPKITATCFEDLNEDGSYDKNEPILENQQITITPEADYTIHTKHNESLFYVYPGEYQLENLFYAYSGEHQLKYELDSTWHLTTKIEDLTVNITEKDSPSNTINVFIGYTKNIAETPEIPETPKAEIVEPPVKKNKIEKRKSLENITDIACGETLELSQLRFKPNTATFLKDDAANDYLEILVQYLKSNNNHEIDLYGHTDFLSNNKAYLVKLSQERVDKVKSFLVKQGIDKNRINTEAFGGTKPIVTDRAAQQRSQNRRVEVHIICE